MLIRQISGEIGQSKKCHLRMSQKEKESKSHMVTWYPACEFLQTKRFVGCFLAIVN
jgi:hypothetical protein